MPQDAKTRRALILATIVVFSLGIFLLDWRGPMGLAGWAGYILPLIVSGFLNRPRMPLLLAAVFSGLIVLAYLDAPHQLDPQTAVLNRLTGLVVLWIVALIESRRLQTQNRLRESEARLHSLFKILPAGISLVGRDRKYVRMNPALASLLELPPSGTDAGELPGMGRFLRGDGTALAVEDLPSMRAIREQRVILDTEVGIIRKDGAVTWVTANAAPLPGVGAAIALVDITRRKLAEQKLAESEERYRRLFNEMSEGFALHELICDAADRPCDYRFLEINPAFERLTGLRRDKVVGRLLTEVLPNEDPQWLACYGQVALSGEPAHFEHFSTALNRHYELDAYCPAPRQFAVLFVDITARKRVEHLVQEQYRELENLYHSLPIGLGVIDRQFRFLKINDRLAAINGRPALDHLGRTIYEMIPDVAATLEPVYRRVFTTGEAVCNLELTRLSRTQPVEERNYLASYHPLKAGDGHVYGICSVVVDITERKIAEQSLVESEERFRSAMQYSGIGMAIVLPAGRFLEVNPVLCGILGYAWAELLAMNFQALTHPEDQAGNQAFISRLLQGEIETYQFELRFRHQNGHYILGAIKCVHHLAAQRQRLPSCRANPGHHQPQAGLAGPGGERGTLPLRHAIFRHRHGGHHRHRPLVGGQPRLVGHPRLFPGRIAGGRFPFASPSGRPRALPVRVGGAVPGRNQNVRTPTVLAPPRRPPPLGANQRLAHPPPRGQIESAWSSKCRMSPSANRRPMNSSGPAKCFA